MAQNQGNSSSSGGRLDGSLGNTAVAADFVLGAGWGSSTFVVTAGSTDQRGELVITGVTGGGLAQATATIAHTFHDGAWAAKPWATVKCTNDNSLTAASDFTVNQAATSTTVCTWTYQVLPVNAKVYTVRYQYVQ
jgi:hypothetical protein